MNDECMRNDIKIEIDIEIQAPTAPPIALRLQAAAAHQMHTSRSVSR
jgi:hypothetical protein